MNSLPINPIDILPPAERTNTADPPRKVKDSPEPDSKKDRSFESVLEDVEAPPKEEEITSEPEVKNEDEAPEPEDFAQLAVNLLTAASQDPEFNLLGTTTEPTLPLVDESLVETVPTLTSDVTTLVQPTTEELDVAVDSDADLVEVLPAETEAPELTLPNQLLESSEDVAPVQAEALASNTSPVENVNDVDSDAAENTDPLESVSEEGSDEGLSQDGLSQDGQSSGSEGETVAETVIEANSPVESIDSGPAEVVRAPEVVTDRPSVSAGLESRDAVNLAQNVADSTAFNPVTASASRSVNANQFLPGPATLQAASAIQTKFTSFVDEPRQTISVELHPPDLGRLQITVEQSSDHVVAQIVATEFNSTELLLQEKDFLQEALADLGFGEASVDISHGGADQNEANEDQQGAVPRQYKTSQSELDNRPVAQVSSTGVNFLA